MKRQEHHFYHMEPIDGLVGGSHLYPLNELKTKYPDVFLKHKAKYNSRPHLMECKLELPNCLWNDVIHLSAVDISLILETMIRVFKEEQSSRIPKAAKKFYYYEIPESLLDLNQLYILKRERAGDTPKEILHETINNLLVSYVGNAEKLETTVPKLQEEYFRKCAHDLSLPAYLFTGIRHVLYKGAIDISKCRKLCVEIRGNE